MPQDVMQRRLAATVSGAGTQVIVFGNGVGTTQHTWRHIVRVLEPHARLVRFDNVCSPAAPPGQYRAEVYGSLHAYADDLIGLLDELDVRDAIFVGHSISGIIGMLAAVAAPERIGHLVVICSAPRFVEDVDYQDGFPRDRIDAILAEIQHDFPAWAHGFVRTALGPDATPAQIEEFRTTLTAMQPDIALRIFQTVFLGDNRAVLGRVKQPVSVLQTRHDAAIPLTAGEYLVQQLPNASLVPLESQGHVPHLVAPDEVAEAILGVLATRA